MLECFWLVQDKFVLKSKKKKKAKFGTHLMRTKSSPKNQEHSICFIFICCWGHNQTPVFELFLLETKIVEYRSFHIIWFRTTLYRTISFHLFLLHHCRISAIISWLISILQSTFLYSHSKTPTLPCIHTKVHAHTYMHTREYTRLHAHILSLSFYFTQISNNACFVLHSHYCPHRCRQVSDQVEVEVEKCTSLLCTSSTFQGSDLNN